MIAAHILPMDKVDAIIAQWHRERPDLDVGPMETIGRLGRLARHLSREMEKTFAAHGLSAPGFDVLATLRRSGAPYALSPGDLLATTMVTSGSMTNRIDQLEKAGLVERRQNPEDRRSVVISLTETGFATIDACVTAHVETQARLLATLTPADKATLDGLLRSWLAEFDGA